MDEQPLYSRLSRSTNIRVLNIEASSTPENISCILEELELGNEGNFPYFTAVSYRWGSDQSRENVLVNGKNVLVGRNLHAFLSHALCEGWHFNLWIDALCINQDDNAEKSQQVFMMSEIYSRAAKVPIWLGCLSEEESSSLFTIKQKCDYLIKTRGLAGERLWGEPSAHILLRFDELDEKTQQGLTNFVTNPYWMRKWIIQEVFLSGCLAVVITCDSGQPTIGLADIAPGISFILTWIRMHRHWYKERLSQLENKNQTSPLQKFKVLGDCLGWVGEKGRFEGLQNSLCKFWHQHWYEERLSQLEDKNQTSPLQKFKVLGDRLGWVGEEGRFVGLQNSLCKFWETVSATRMTFKPWTLINLIEGFKEHECKDPRDHVYGLLGLSTAKRGRLIIDYCITLEQLCEAVWEVVQEDNAGHDKKCIQKVLGL
jgi:hypothetical protein